MTRSRPLLLCTALAAALPLAGQEPPAPASGGFRFHPLVEVGGAVEDRARLAALLAGDAPGVLRSPSSATPRPAGAYLRLLAPVVGVAWNSAIPFSLNDGPVWAGKGTTAWGTAGIDAGAGPLRLVVAPRLVHARHASFDALTEAALTDADRASRIPPWQTGEHSIDLPYRFADGPGTELHPGESSLTLRVGAVEAGGATESQWWGPGVRNAIVLGNAAGGFPHLLLRTARPLATPLGRLEARWIAGRLSSSAFDTASVGRHRSLSAAAVSLAPGGGLTVGAARAVYAPREGNGFAADAPAVFLRWRDAGDTLASRPYQQVASIFARWVAPAEGVEVYAEWGRHRLPASPRDFLEQPDHTQGYTLGAGWARPAGAGVARLRAEATFLEKSATYRSRPTGSWYAGRAVPQGYTHRGQPLGAAIGPGASSQWAAADYLRDRWEVGAGLTRVRWANDAYYDKPGGPNIYLAHDVSVLGTLHGAVRLGGMRVDAEWTAGRRYNFLFQNTATWWGERDQSISPINHSLRLRLSAVPPRLPGR